MRGGRRFPQNDCGGPPPTRDGSPVARRIAAYGDPTCFAALPTAERPARPVFVIGCPRSGMSLFSRRLALGPDLVSIRPRGQSPWEAFTTGAVTAGGRIRSAPDM
jgi:hypothetical protein